MQLNAKKCHTKEGSVTVDVGLVEVDRGECRLIDFAHATVVLAIGVAHEIM